MATLEKIRSHRKLLFGIVIGAMVLFIVSIADANMFRNWFGPGTKVAQAGNLKIEYTDYRDLVDKLGKQGRNPQAQDNDQLSQTAIQQLIAEALLNEQIDLMGINVTDAQITQAMTGDTPHPAAMRFIQGIAQALQLPDASGKVVLDAITNPAKYNIDPAQLNMFAQQAFGTPTMLDAWAQTEKDVEKTIKQQTFNNLLTRMMTANKLDAKMAFNDNNSQSIVSFATASYNSVPANDLKATDDELKAKWAELKPEFKIAEETRYIDYIVVPLQPSANDNAEAEKIITDFVAMLKNPEAKSDASLYSKFQSEPTQVKVSDIKKNQALKAMPDSLIHTGGVYRFPAAGNISNIAKVNKVYDVIDSLNISVYVAENKAAADSVLKQIQDGKTTFKALVADGQQGVDSIWQSLVGADERIAKVMESAVVGQPFVFQDTVNGKNGPAQIYKVNERKPMRQYADITVYTHTTDPSSATIADIKKNLGSFLASNSKADKFSQNADSVYNLQHAYITASTPNLGQPGSRKAIKWAMEAKKGQVSPIMEVGNDFYIVVALQDVFEEQYLPWNAPQVKDRLSEEVATDKKAEYLIKQYKGKAKDIAGYATAMNTTLLTDSTFVFNGEGKGNLGRISAEARGQIAAAKPGTVVGPVKSNDGVIVFTVNGDKKDSREFNETIDGNGFIEIFGIKDRLSLLLGNRKVENKLLKFESNEY